MSFSGMVKEELSRQVSTARHCRIAEIAALLSACGRMTADGILHFQTENYAVVRKYFTLLTKTFNIDTAIAIRESCQMKKGKVYFVEIADPAQIETVIQGTKLSVDKCSRAAVSGLLSAGRFWHPVRSVIRRKGIILKSSVQTSRKQSSFGNLSAALRSMPKLSCARSHMWSM